MSERLQHARRKSDGENPQIVCLPAYPPPTSRIPCRKKSSEATSVKKMNFFNNQQKRTDTTYTCACTQCSNKISCCCVDLETIEEEHDQCEDLCAPYVEQTVQDPLGASSSSKNISSKKPSDSSQAAEEDDPCGEFFDIMRETMEDAVKKTLDSCFSQHFTVLFEKLDALRCQMERSECIICKVYADLNDKISYYGERNAQQFQYLCVRMEHDRLFYQQQQEFFLKAVAKCPQGLEFFGGKDQTQQSDQDAAGAQTKCPLQKATAKCVNDERRSKGNGRECRLTVDEVGPCGEENDKESPKSTDSTKGKGSTDMGQRRSESAGPAIGREQATGKSSKKK